MPEPPESVPLQLTGNEAAVVVAASVFTRLDGYTVSMVLVTVFVLIDELTSNTIEPWLEMAVPLARPDFGLTLKVTYPVPRLLELFGGRKPASGLAGRPPVVRSTDCMVQLRTPVSVLSAALTLTGFGSVDTFTWPTYACKPA